VRSELAHIMHTNKDAYNYPKLHDNHEFTEFMETVNFDVYRNLP